MKHTLQTLVDIHKFIDAGSFITEELINLNKKSEFAFSFHNIDCYFVKCFKENMTIRILWSVPLVGVILLNPLYKKQFDENSNKFIHAIEFELYHEIGHLNDPMIKPLIMNQIPKKENESRSEYFMRTYNENAEIYADNFAVRLYGVEQGISFLTNSIKQHEKKLSEDIDKKLSTFAITKLNIRLCELMKKKL